MEDSEMPSRFKEGFESAHSYVQFLPMKKPRISFNNTPKNKTQRRSTKLALKKNGLTPMTTAFQANA